MTHGWLNSKMWGNHRYGRLTVSYMQINPHAIQRSTAYTRISLEGYKILKGKIKCRGRILWTEVMVTE